jgi:hypothetical protein
MRFALPFLAAGLLVLVGATPPGALAQTGLRPASCSAAAKGWKGEATGTRIEATRPVVEQRVIVLVNRFRRHHGRPSLKLDAGLRAAARARGVIDTSLTARLALYTPSRCVVEHVVRQGGLTRAAGIVRDWQSRPAARRVLLLPWVRRIGVGVRSGTLGGKRVTVTTVDFSAARPKVAKHTVVKRKARPAPSIPTPAPGTVTSGPVVGVPFVCDGPVDGVRVVGTGSDARALVVLAAGCTGRLSFDVHITSGGGDGVKVLGGVHDLAVGPSRIVCDRLTDTSFHQDGVQVQGGTNVLFSGLSVVCPFVTGQGAAGFYIDGKDFDGISDVVCDGCNLEHLHYGAMFTGPAPGSGVRNSIIHQGALTHGWFDLVGDLAGALNSNNTLAPPCDDVTVAC